MGDIIRFSLQSSIEIKFFEKIFDSMNKNIFNNHLNGVKLKLFDEMKARTSISLSDTSISYPAAKNHIICINRSLLEKCTRKQTIETLLVSIMYIKLLIFDENAGMFCVSLIWSPIELFDLPPSPVSIDDSFKRDF